MKEEVEVLGVYRSTLQNDIIPPMKTGSIKSEIIDVVDKGIEAKESIIEKDSKKKKKKGKKKGDDDNDDDKEDEENKPKGPPEPPPVSMFQLFRFAEGIEIFLLIFGMLCATAQGLCMPAMTILFGDMTDSLVNFGAQSDESLTPCYNLSIANITEQFNKTCNAIYNISVTFPDLNWEQPNCTNPNPDRICHIIRNMSLEMPSLNWTTPNCISGDEFHNEIWRFAVGLSIIGAVQLTLGYVMVSCMNSAAERQVFRIRDLFFKAVLRQNIGWYDTHQTGEFASRTADDLGKLQDGIGEKIGMFIFFIGTFLFSIVNAFLHGWQLTLVILSVTPVMVVAMGAIGKVQTSLAENEMKAYAKAGAVAEEALTAIRTVTAFGGEKKEVARYEQNLVSATSAGIKRGMTTALGASTLWFVIFASYALAFWYGVKLIVTEKDEVDPAYTASNMIIVFFSVLMGAMNMGQSAPYIEAFSQARAAAASVYEVIDRIPPIDSSSTEGLRQEKVEGNIEFDDVHFNYPSRPDVRILNGLSLKIKNGETVALVGESGCGKSTTVQLMQRFYDPDNGTVKLDGCDIRLLNIGWLRDQVGIVGQEPILFGTTIAENIKYGFEGATQEDVEKAAKMANAHNFIMKLPKKYETMVGDRGTQLSGGQKQRVAIARALIKNPKILLLDEATSALDSESEAVVQEALDKARLGRTTLIIAHRLSTIRNADKIAAIQDGKVVEIGTHEELMSKSGIYHTLVTTQTGDKDKEQLQLEEVESDERPHLQLQRSISALSENPVDAVLDNAAVMLGRQPSLRKRKNFGSISSTGSGHHEVIPELKPSLWKVLTYNQEEWVYIVLGCVGAVGMGFSMPAFSLVFGDIMGVLDNCNTDQIMDDAAFYSCLFLVIGIASAIASFLQLFSFSYAGEYLTKRLRKLSFGAILKQEMGWFDDTNNSIGALCSRLSADAASVQGATGSRIGTILQSFCTLGASSIIALILCWQLALVNMCFVPFVLLATYMHAKVIMGQTVVEMESIDKANRIAIDCISNIRTVASLHKEMKFHGIYMDFLIGPHETALKKTHIRGIVFGFAQSVPFFAYAATMYYGGVLVEHHKLDYATVFKVSELLIMGTMMVGQAFAFAPNYNKGIMAAARIFQLLDRKPLIDSSLESGLKLPDKTPGKIKFQNVEFQYPARPNMPVLRGLDLEINPGHVVALVGSSGCGKSTCIQLLERFYDPANGQVTMDGTDVAQLNIGWLRSRIGIVSQEPILFDRSIAQNIAYGDNFREVPMDEIIQAAKNANIHNFITALPEGYETSVGDKGTQLSGGQKQRIAIARALVRNPKILLLDEATSALDTESEKVVQEALEQAQKGRTCITVAHRLSTIKDANQIAVIHHGKVVELGTHDELMVQHGHYFRFYQTQSKGHM
ncbi:hypothetical protein CHUAL_002862 [Chamberlinius hualienensis]